MRWPWEDPDEAANYDDPVTSGPECFACSHCRPSDACDRLVALAAKPTRRNLAIAEAAIAYRAVLQSDPHSTCAAFEMADKDTLQRRKRLWEARERLGPTR